jgi:hypothetical protein
MQHAVQGFVGLGKEWVSYVFWVGCCAMLQKLIVLKGDCCHALQQRFCCLIVLFVIAITGRARFNRLLQKNRGLHFGVPLVKKNM